RPLTGRGGRADYWVSPRPSWGVRRHPITGGWLSAAYGVALHAAGVGGGVQDAVAAGYRADPAQGPGRADGDQVAAAAEVLDDRLADPRLDVQGQGLGLARVERRRHVRGVERGEVDRLLQVHAERQVVEEEQQRPLILLVAAWRAEREVRLAVPQRQARAERGARPLARREGGRQPG